MNAKVKSIATMAGVALGAIFLLNTLANRLAPAAKLRDAVFTGV